MYINTLIHPRRKIDTASESKQALGSPPVNPRAESNHCLVILVAPACLYNLGFPQGLCFFQCLVVCLAGESSGQGLRLGGLELVFDFCKCSCFSRFRDSSRSLSLCSSLSRLCCSAILSWSNFLSSCKQRAFSSSSFRCRSASLRAFLRFSFSRGFSFLF